NRDHRKITVIDGEIAYTGGANLADEYINRIERFGYWKDANIRVTGEVIANFTLMFLQMWNFDEKSDHNDLSYLEEHHQRENIQIESDSYFLA
ncbi:cardiolipin synthase, partial [Streptococcus pyogenes]